MTVKQVANVVQEERLVVVDLTKTVNGRDLLRQISFTVREGDFVGVLGSSGAGKSLTIRCILNLTEPTSGRIMLRLPGSAPRDISALHGRRLREVRRHIAVIFQGLHLVKRLSVLENVMIGRLGHIHPLRSLLYGFTDDEAAEAMLILERLNMAAFAGRLAGTLSGGELQRVAVARAMFHRPAVYLADEPISSLDPKNAEAIMKLLKPLSAEAPIVGAFHQPEMTRHYCSRVIGIRDGQVVYDGSPDLTSADLREIYGAELDPASFSRPVQPLHFHAVSAAAGLGVR